MPTGTPAHAERISRGTTAFRRTNLAMFAAGFSTFALVYCVQPLMPELARTFRVSAATSALSLSVTTGVLAGALLVVGGLAESWGRKPIMAAALTIAALLTLLTAVVPSWHALLALRATEGLAFAGLPALAMAYLGEEIDADSIGLAMGLYIGGSALGGMSGRLLTAALADVATWREAVAAVGAIGVVAAVVFARSLPPSRHFHARPPVLRAMLAAYAEHLREPRLARLFAEAFLLMGSFVTAYNYLGFRLLAPPYSLRQSAAGAVFLAYLVGVGSSSWVGAMAGRVGRPAALRGSIALMLGGVALTAARPLALVVAGVIVLTFGFFGAHSVASSWVGLTARSAKAQASSLYLFFYYAGASAAGWFGGVCWTAWGWTGVATFIGLLLCAALATALGLSTPNG
jgi:YNFM family putative membrane transporter